jgi:TonB-dependent starch-binding outer membrane protein SusC
VIRGCGAFVVSLMLFPLALHAQDAVTITGSVRAPGGAPIVGARVTGSTTAAFTDVNGAFRISVAGAPNSRRERLRYQSIGFRVDSVDVTLDRALIRLDLTLDIQAVPLDEVVVTGTAGLASRRAQPAVVDVIDARSIVRQTSIANVGELLQGRSTAVSVTPSSGSAGQAQRIRMRGIASLHLSYEPLVFVDGVRIDNRIQRNNANGGQASSRLFDIDPSDIERIEILKGPAAATFYGADASAGVIQLFTRRRSPGETGFNHDVSFAYDLVERAWTPPANFARCRPQDVLPSSSSALCRGRAEGTLVSDHPLARADVLRNGYIRSIDWRARGGSPEYGFNLSVSADNEEGTLPQNRFQRRAGRIGFTATPGPELTVDAEVGLMRSVTALPQNNDNPIGFFTGMLGNPLTVGTALDGWFAPGGADRIAAIEQVNTVLRATPSLQIRHQPHTRLRHRLIIGGDVTHSDGVLFYPVAPPGSGVFNAGGWIGEDRVQHELFTLDWLADWTLKPEGTSGWTAALSAGAQVVSRRDDFVSASGEGLIVNEANAVAAAARRSGTQRENRERAAGWLAQLQASYHNRVFLLAGARLDRNSSFGEHADDVVLPRAGASYVISDESWWPRVLEAISTLRLRAAIGTTGRSPLPGTTIPTYAAQPFVTPEGTTGQGVYPLSPGNPRLRPERGVETEIGLDAGLFDDRAAVEVTHFHKTARDLLLQRPLPASYGFGGTPFENIGRVVNRGLEAAVRATLIDRAELVWEARVGAAWTDSKIVALGGVAIPGREDFRIVEGRAPGAIFARRLLRVDESAGYAVVTDTAEWIGNPDPRFSGFAQTLLSIGKTLTIHSQLEWKVGHHMMNATAYVRDHVVANTELRARMDELPAEERLRRFGPFQTANGQQVDATEDGYMEDASFMRWRELSLRWRPRAPNALRRIGARGAAITAAVRNVALWTGYDGDPEVVSYISEGGLAQLSNIDFLTMPQPRRIMLRVELEY